ncbi:hypothetical protein [Devosia sp. RR2S18]|uniref:hypothetical protein n=1 Tax=Devosia rhizosphaerae TaxID=3049774 RepID=UPI002542592C|nr:hypothetical protein [Devosia sp. RR2S18]WIJ26584.1 hypothetical protein QOV41_07490 [Devosia sp. RR2S18]
MPSTTTPAAVEGMPKISARDVMINAWAGYRKMARTMREARFNRERFAYELRMAWANARADMPKPAAPAAPARAKPAITDPVKATRVAEIAAELQWMDMGDFTDWNRHRQLSVELAQIAA